MKIKFAYHELMFITIGRCEQKLHEGEEKEPKQYLKSEMKFFKLQSASN